MENTPMEPEAYTLAQAAKLLQVSTRTLRNWIKRGEIQAYKLGLRQWRIRHEEVARLLKRPPPDDPSDAPYGDEYE